MPLITDDHNTSHETVDHGNVILPFYDFIALFPLIIPLITATSYRPLRRLYTCRSLSAYILYHSSNDRQQNSSLTWPCAQQLNISFIYIKLQQLKRYLFLYDYMCICIPATLQLYA